MIIEFPVLESIKDLQAQHGLKYENYRRYRSYCSRRLHRLRRSLNVHQGIASSAKARHQRARKLTDISNAMVLEAGEKNQEYGERMLMIPLCLAERAWSYAMQLKQETSEHPRRRFHLFRRLFKASEYAQRFEKLCYDPESPCSQRTKEEATAYAGYITGLYKMEREIWADAKENLNKALAIYFKLCLSIKKEEVLEHYRQRIDEIRASLRYCAFNFGDQDSKKQVKVKLPAVLQFHDIAFKHAVQLKESEQAQAKKSESIKEPVVKMDIDRQQPAGSAPADHEEEDDEFEETREAHSEYGESEESDDSDDDEDKQGSKTGGVTGLVKNWLGGAWS